MTRGRLLRREWSYSSDGMNLTFLERALAAIVVAVVITSGPSWAQNRQTKSDPRLVKALQSQRIKYKVGDGGRISATLNVTGSERRHVVTLESVTNSFRDFEVRQVWAYACTIEGTISASLAQRLLEENGRKPLGGWELLRSDQASTVIFTAKVPADIDGKRLRTVLGIVVDTADALEEELTQKDDL